MNLMLKQTVLAFSIVTLHLEVGFSSDIVAALKEEEIPPVTDISGFHSLHDKANDLDVRVLEADVSADVARNPVALFLVITDNASGGEGQVHVWRLPSVSIVKKLVQTKSGISITVMWDGVADEKTGKFPMKNETINVSYSMANEILSDKITVTAPSP